MGTECASGAVGVGGPRGETHGLLSAAEDNELHAHASCICIRRERQGLPSEDADPPCTAAAAPPVAAPPAPPLAAPPLTGPLSVKRLGLEAARSACSGEVVSPPLTRKRPRVMSVPSRPSGRCPAGSSCSCGILCGLAANACSLLPAAACTVRACPCGMLSAASPEAELPNICESEGGGACRCVCRCVGGVLGAAAASVPPCTGVGSSWEPGLVLVAEAAVGTAPATTNLRRTKLLAALLLLLAPASLEGLTTPSGAEALAGGGAEGGSAPAPWGDPAS